MEEAAHEERLFFGDEIKGRSRQIKGNQRKSKEIKENQRESKEIKRDFIFFG